MTSSATSSDSSAGRTRAKWLRQPLRWLGSTIRLLVRVGFIGWAGLAIWYSTVPWMPVRLALALAFVAFGVWALWFAPKPRGLLLFIGIYLIVLLLWSTILPSHDRQWRADVAVMPRAYIDGDTVRLTGVRNFDYLTVNEFSPRYEEREVSLAHMTGVDFYISYWMPGPVGHTFVSFTFDDAPPLSISIEIRPEVGEGYAPIASLFKQFELIYVVGDERDIVRVRTNVRGEDVYLYRVAAPADDARRLFELYLARINQLADKPEVYHLLSNSCTINIVRYMRALGGSRRFNARHYLNGLFDAYLFDQGLLNTSLSFEELRRRSHINAAAEAANDAPDFSTRIRAQLPASATRATQPRIQNRYVAATPLREGMRSAGTTTSLIRNTGCNQRELGCELLAAGP